MITETKLPNRNKGGRPAKAVKRNKVLGVKCTLVEKRTIEAKAKYSGVNVSEYLRNLALSSKIDMRKIRIPKEILQFTGTLNHLAANLNQIAKKRNQLDELNALERAQLNQLSLSVKQLAVDIKNYIK
ncbi:MAG: mobilization protein [Chitinophagaceae bacterium]|nr:mobilization protein [Chitinophagaceae bacterium]MCA6459286.1 mobilization protein [Chitinophagaceae bacterium]MCA6464656.1 mobilization protein [Chitinophagaceae bacterium]